MHVAPCGLQQTDDGPQTAPAQHCVDDAHLYPTLMQQAPLRHELAVAPPPQQLPSYLHACPFGTQQNPASTCPEQQYFASEAPTPIGAHVQVPGCDGFELPLFV